MEWHYSKLIIQLSLIIYKSNVLWKVSSLPNLWDSPQNNGRGEAKRQSRILVKPKLAAEIELTHRLNHYP